MQQEPYNLPFKVFIPRVAKSLVEQPRKDLNFLRKSQSLMYYHYTTGLGRGSFDLNEDCWFWRPESYQLDESSISASRENRTPWPVRNPRFSRPLITIDVAGISEGMKPSNRSEIAEAGFEPASPDNESVLEPLQSIPQCRMRDLNSHVHKRLSLNQMCIPIPPIRLIGVLGIEPRTIRL